MSCVFVKPVKTAIKKTNKHSVPVFTENWNTSVCMSSWTLCVYVCVCSCV